MDCFLITGAAGFIGTALCSRLSSDNKVVGIDLTKSHVNHAKITWEQADLTDGDSVAVICEKYFPDVVIHCAGIAHQKIGAVDSVTYMRVNSEATENIAKAAAKSNPDVHFIFLSSVSVYGEGPQITPVPSSGATGQAQISQIKQIKTNNKSVGEDGKCRPSSDYAVSKLDAERRLIALSDKGTLNSLVILRLAPVYDFDWSFNLDRRVLAPKKAAYIRFGSGFQRMSALARPNLVEFIEFLLQRWPPIQGIKILNVCDSQSYEFNTIIRILRKSGICPNRPAIPVPLPVVWIATRIAGVLLPNKRNWLHSCYDKLALSLVFNNEKMLGTGFKPRHSLETVFAH